MRTLGLLVPDRFSHAPQTRKFHCFPVEPSHAARFHVGPSCEECAGRRYSSCQPPYSDHPFGESSRHSHLQQSETLLFPLVIFVSRRTTPRNRLWTMCFALCFPAPMSTSLRNTSLRSRP